MKCIICGENEATIPDRNEGPWGKRKKVCKECHTNRLRNDFIGILEIERKRRQTAAEQEGCPHKNIQTAWSYIPGECVKQPDYEQCVDCGEIF